jgi:hypothetical protein
MKQALIALVLAPLVLAPVYYQGREMGEAGPVEPGSGIEQLPAATELESPLLVTPSAVAVSVSAVGEDGKPVEIPSREPDKGGVVNNPVTCMKGLATIEGLGALAYQHAPADRFRSAYMGVMVAAALGRQQLEQGYPPNLATLRKRLHAVRRGGTLRDQLLQAYVLAESACLPPDGTKQRAAPVVQMPER